MSSKYRLALLILSGCFTVSSSAISFSWSGLSSWLNPHQNQQQQPVIKANSSDQTKAATQQQTQNLKAKYANPFNLKKYADVNRCAQSDDACRRNAKLVQKLLDSPSMLDKAPAKKQAQHPHPHHTRSTPPTPRAHTNPPMRKFYTIY